MPKPIESIADLIPDPQNANLGTERGGEMLHSSLEEYGAGRGVVVDRNGVIIAGNKTVEQARAMGLEIQSVHTVGDRLVVTVRDDLDLKTDAKAKALGLADNRIGQVNLAFDPEILRELSEEVDLSGLWTEKEMESVFAMADPSTMPLADIDLQESSEQAVGYETRIAIVLPPEDYEDARRILLDLNREHPSWDVRFPK